MKKNLILYFIFKNSKQNNQDIQMTMLEEKNVQVVHVLHI